MRLCRIQKCEAARNQPKGKRYRKIGLLKKFHDHSRNSVRAVRGSVQGGEQPKQEGNHPVASKILGLSFTTSKMGTYMQEGMLIII